MALLANKKARFNYEILKTFEAGIELLGTEVKSLRAKRGKLEGAHVIVRPSGRSGGSEAFLVGASIPAYQPANAPKDYDPERVRRLLLTGKELAELSGADTQKGLTLVPLSLYSKGQKLKVEFALARGKKKHDKRQTLKDREARRTIERSLKTR
jgi:SsrA-binding protein